jgi:hypothetical protein
MLDGGECFYLERIGRERPLLRHADPGQQPFDGPKLYGIQPLLDTLAGTSSCKFTFIISFSIGRLAAALSGTFVAAVAAAFGASHLNDFICLRVANLLFHLVISRC